MKILITYLTGIGNTVMFIPALRTLRQQLPDATIDVLVRHNASKDILKRVNCTRTIYVFNPNHHNSFVSKLRFLRTLRQERYDVSITTSPSNRAEFNLLSFFIGAKRKISLRYKVGYIETLGFLQNELIEADARRHEIDQNLSLLSPLGVNISFAERERGFRLDEQELAYADEFMRKAKISAEDTLIGFHPGCNPAQGNLYRRWSPQYFAKLGDKLIDTFGVKILVGFGGRDENHLSEEIARLMKHKPIIPENVSILETAALIKRCKLFVASDSGLMHIATAMNVPTVVLYGPIDPGRDAPPGPNHLVIQAKLPCVPCNKYPYYQYGGSYIRCIYDDERKGFCMQSLTPEHVYENIVRTYASLLTSGGK